MGQPIADWDTAKLARYVEDMIRQYAPSALVNVSAEDVTANNTLIVADQISMSQQALDYIRSPFLYSSVEASQNTTSTGYTNLSTVGPSITFPLAGRWLLGWGAGIEMVTTTGGERAWASFDGTDANGVMASGGNSNSTSQGGSVSRFLPFTSTQGQVLTLTYRTSNGTSCAFSKRWITAWPIPA